MEGYNPYRPGNDPQPSGQYAWVNTGRSWQGGGTQQPAAPQAPAPTPRKKRSPVAVVALLLACLLCGFGGGALALSVFGGSGNTPSVVYRAPDVLNTADPTAKGNPTSLSDVAELAGASVVSISTENIVRNPLYGGQVVSGAGSGVILTEDGMIITNNHVVEGAHNITVTLPDGTELPATLVGTDPATDVAVVKVEAENLVPAVLGNSDKLRVGDTCLAIGNPMGTLGGTVTDGIISALDRNVVVGDYAMNLLQMSAAVSPGNSGGGLFDANGHLIGIVNAKSGGDETEGLGFAIPVNTAMEVAQQLIENGQVSGRPGLGVTVLTANSDAAMAQAGVEEPGVYISELARGGAAENAGLLVGDKIVSIDDAPISIGEDIRASLSDKGVGDSLHIVVKRSGTEIAFTLVLGELAAAA